MCVFRKLFVLVIVRKLKTYASIIKLTGHLKYRDYLMVMVPSVSVSAFTTKLLSDGDGISANFQWELIFRPLVLMAQLMAPKLPRELRQLLRLPIQQLSHLDRQCSCRNWDLKSFAGRTLDEHVVLLPRLAWKSLCDRRPIWKKRKVEEVRVNDNVH